MEYFLIILAGIFVNNYVLSQFLGICPFLGVSKKVETAAGMGVAVIFVMTVAAMVANLVYDFILVPLGIDYLYNIFLNPSILIQNNLVFLCNLKFLMEIYHF